MPAYTKELHLICHQSGCFKKATKEVFNTYNASMGRFCTRHAHQEIIRLDKLK